MLRLNDTKGRDEDRVSHARNPGGTYDRDTYVSL